MELEDLPCFVAGFDPEHNLRDLGGWLTVEGRRVRRGLVYRSGRFSGMSDAELVRLQQLGLRCVVDLRGEEERSTYPDPRFPSMRAVAADAGREVLFADSDHILQEVASRTAEMAFGNAGVAAVLSLMLKGEVPLLFHCNSGRDRSGVVAMVVLMALGCPDEVLLEDYLLTNAYRAGMIRQVFDSYREVAPLDAASTELLTLMAGVLPQVGSYVLATIDGRYDSREAYLTAEYGLDAGKLAELRRRYTEELA